MTSEEPGADGLQQVAESMHEDVSGGARELPKYQKLYGLFLNVIETGLWKPGERLPPETVLAKKIPVSLGTIQKALRMLVDSGVVTRRHGHGTFVAGVPTTPGKIRNFRFLSDDGVTLLPVYSRLLVLERRTAPGPWTRIFPDENGFVYIRRLFSVNLEFQAYAEAYLPEKRFGRFLEMSSRELDGSALTYMLGEQFNAPALNVTHHFSQLPLPADVSAQIGVVTGTVGTEWELIGRSYRNEAIFYQRFYLPPHGRKIEVNPVEVSLPRVGEYANRGTPPLVKSGG